MNTDLPDLKFHEICRVCLEKNDAMRSVFSELDPSELLEADTLYLFQVLIKITSTRVQENDGLPSLICSNCVGLIHGAYKFKVQFDYSHGILKHYCKIEPELQPNHKSVQIQTDVSNQQNGVNNGRNRKVKERKLSSDDFIVQDTDDGSDDDFICDIDRSASETDFISCSETSSTTNSVSSSDKNNHRKQSRSREHRSSLRLNRSTLSSAARKRRASEVDEMSTEKCSDDGFTLRSSRRITNSHVRRLISDGSVSSSDSVKPDLKEPCEQKTNDGKQTEDKVDDESVGNNNVEISGKQENNSGYGKSPDSIKSYFNSETNLIHRDVTEYSCNHCDFGTKYSTSLRRHLKRHKKEQKK